MREPTLRGHAAGSSRPAVALVLRPMCSLARPGAVGHFLAAGAAPQANCLLVAASTQQQVGWRKWGENRLKQHASDMRKRSISPLHSIWCGCDRCRLLVCQGSSHSLRVGT